MALCGSVFTPCAVLRGPSTCLGTYAHPTLCTLKCLPTEAMLSDSHWGVDKQPSLEACDSASDLLCDLGQVGHYLSDLGAADLSNSVWTLDMRVLAGVRHCPQGQGLRDLSVMEVWETLCV